MQRNKPIKIFGGGKGTVTVSFLDDEINQRIVKIIGIYRDELRDYKKQVGIEIKEN